MIIIFLILIVTTLLAYFAESKTSVARRNGLGRVQRYKIRRVNNSLFYILLALFVFFVGLRGSHNDTAAYLIVFKNLDTSLELFSERKWNLAFNPGFQISNYLIKILISDNPHVMLFLYALVTLTFYFIFYRKWSQSLWVTVYLFIVAGMLLFTMAALKQVLAMSIGLYGITCFLTNKHRWFVFCVLLASSIHVYVLFYLLAPLLSDRLWSRKVILIILGAVSSGVFVEFFLQLAYGVTGIFGAEYEKYDEVSGEGLNILRFFVYCCAPVLTWIYREKINGSRKRAVILFANFTLIGWCFMFIGLFVGANMLARMAMYFDPFMHLALTSLLVFYIPDWNRRYILPGFLLGYLLYFSFDLYSRGFVYRSIFN